MMPKWLLDTNSCIAIMNRNPESVGRELIRHPVEAVGMSVVSLYELEYGITRQS